MVMAVKHSPRGSRRAHQWIHQLTRPRLWLSLMGLMLEVVLLVSWSKSRQEVKELSKVENPWCHLLDAWGELIN